MPIGRLFAVALPPKRDSACLLPLKATQQAGLLADVGWRWVMSTVWESMASFTVERLAFGHGPQGGVFPSCCSCRSPSPAARRRPCRCARPRPSRRSPHLPARSHSAWPSSATTVAVAATRSCRRERAARSARISTRSLRRTLNARTCRSQRSCAGQSWIRTHTSRRDTRETPCRAVSARSCRTCSSRMSSRSSLGPRAADPQPFHLRRRPRHGARDRTRAPSAVAFWRRDDRWSRVATSPPKDKRRRRIVSAPSRGGVGSGDAMLERWEEDHDLRGDGATSASAKRRNGRSAASRP
jgi:hypothetical protein